MTTSFPTSLDSLTNPTSSDATNSGSVPHATQHANANDAIEALQARVGVVGSAVTSSLTYRIAALETAASTGAWSTWTPVVTQGSSVTFTNNRSVWTRVGRIVHARATVTFTANGTASNAIYFSLPVTAATSVSENVGSLSVTGATYQISTALLSSTTTVAFAQNGASSLFGVSGFTIASTQVATLNVSYEAAS